MRTDIVHIGAGELTYEIRNIVNVGMKLQKLGLTTNWENIGDPIAKGEQIPLWMKEIVAEAVMDNVTYGYCPTKGVLSTREFIAAETNKRGGAQIDPEDIIFFNGLGDAIAKVFGFLRSTARVLVPTPSYTTHSSAEAAHAGDKPLTYILDPNHHWYPDLDDLEKSIKYNPAVAGILIINPDNPTGAVYPREILEAIVEIAHRYDLFIICDEVYHHIVYNGTSTPSLSDVVGDVPAIAMRGISKEMPWPGSRCGWIEVYNGDKDPMFAKYIQSILNAKMVEVCSTTLPQVVYPKVVTHPAYQGYLEERIRRYEKFSNIAYESLKDVKGVLVNRPNGAFYMSVCFEEGILNHRQTLPIENNEIRKLVESLVAVPGSSVDKRFVYYLLGATGVCVVPLTSFATELQGFRITLLERDEEKFIQIFQTIASSIAQYLKS
ncbi:MAG: pyridoxal phosphate-dependent aminotransferase [Proteobacteria bacterium]|jgi:aspartate/methionine/tyrosine aminotransferase|nr:pyridoxal phosphate-dependent aminotransferase [Desulfocapsa sp.]MBU3945935.1 pyridoxal phosphate-dependent aminotransferase [Pseudomonadota bacterium]MCG2744990.1 pyridoxal phosphate-dependent aminotransferase [Desulfobacteraceae bacterium]MBU3982918.1 pyridoxal phosphate-dependent aminotransferase [Pseudomonadota bacterium]MBU4027499.1 pyridoxal phosphate-dependent aminotransferase [Pseudomonadota bacterium]